MLSQSTRSGILVWLPRPVLFLNPLWVCRSRNWRMTLAFPCSTGQKPVEPTDIGRKVVAQAKVVLQEALRIEELIKSERGEIRGDFFLESSRLWRPIYCHCFSKIHKKYPLVNLIIEELQTQQIINRLNDDQLDAGLLVTPLNVPGIIEKPLFRDPFLVYLSPKHPLLSKVKWHIRTWAWKMSGCWMKGIVSGAGDRNLWKSEKQKFR